MSGGAPLLSPPATRPGARAAARCRRRMLRRPTALPWWCRHPEAPGCPGWRSCRRRRSRRPPTRTHEALGGPGRWLLALPTTHIAGLQVLVRSLRAGLEPWWSPRPPPVSPRFVPFSRRRRWTSPALSSRTTPHWCPRSCSGCSTTVLPSRPCGSSTRFWSAALPRPMTCWRARPLPESPSSRTYGMTETCGGCVYDGVPLPDVGIAIADDGRIRDRGAGAVRRLLRR